MKAKFLLVTGLSAVLAMSALTGCNAKVRQKGGLPDGDLTNAANNNKPAPPADPGKPTTQETNDTSKGVKDSAATADADLSKKLASHIVDTAIVRNESSSSRDRVILKLTIGALDKDVAKLVDADKKVVNINITKLTIVDAATLHAIRVEGTDKSILDAISAKVDIIAPDKETDISKATEFKVTINYKAGDKIGRAVIDDKKSEGGLTIKNADIGKKADTIVAQTNNGTTVVTNKSPLFVKDTLSIEGQDGSTKVAVTVIDLFQGVKDNAVGNLANGSVGFKSESTDDKGVISFSVNALPRSKKLTDPIKGAKIITSAGAESFVMSLADTSGANTADVEYAIGAALTTTTSPAAPAAPSGNTPAPAAGPSGNTPAATSTTTTAPATTTTTPAAPAATTTTPAAAPSGSTPATPAAVPSGNTPAATTTTTTAPAATATTTTTSAEKSGSGTTTLQTGTTNPPPAPPAAPAAAPAKTATAPAAAPAATTESTTTITVTPQPITVQTTTDGQGNVNGATVVTVDDFIDETDSGLPSGTVRRKE